MVIVISLFHSFYGCHIGLVCRLLVMFCGKFHCCCSTGNGVDDSVGLSWLSFAAYDDLGSS